MTNNFHVSDASIPDQPNELRALFDDFIESREVGLRKPDPAFFAYALDRLGVAASDVVFLDDIGMYAQTHTLTLPGSPREKNNNRNVKAAKALGMTTIRVRLGHARQALEELEAILRVPLLDRSAVL